MTIEALLNNSKQTSQRVSRDAQDFENFGYNLTILNELQSKTDTLDNIPTDVFETIQMNQAADAYKVARTNLVGTTRAVLYQIVDQVGNTDRRYTPLTLNKLSSLIYNQLSETIADWLLAHQNGKYDGLKRTPRSFSKNACRK